MTVGLINFYVDAAADFIIDIDQGATGLDDGDEVTWNGLAGPVSGRTFGLNAFTSVQDAIDAADDGETVHIAQGIYNEGQTLIIDKSLSLVGSSAHQTFFTGHNTRRIIQFSDTSGGFLNITNLTLTEGVASDDVGGAIHALGHTDTVHLFNSCITLCSAKKGASIYTNGYVTARNSLFASNFASMAGAAIALGGDHFEEDVATIENCTFSENGNDDPLGICIWFDFQPNPSAQGHASIDGCTFYRNLSNSPTYATVISPNYEWLISVSNSLLVDNGFSLSGTSHGLFRFPNAGSGGSLADNFQNLGGVYNTRSTGVANDLIIETTLANNGGPTPTHALVSGSPAIDAGINSLIPDDTLDQDKDNNFSEAIPFDQRGFGFPRIIDGTVDIGAF